MTIKTSRIVTAASEQLETVEPKRNISLRAEPLSPTLYNTGESGLCKLISTKELLKIVVVPALVERGQQRELRRKPCLNLRCVLLSPCLPLHSQVSPACLQLLLLFLTSVVKVRKGFPPCSSWTAAFRVLGGHASDSDSMGGALTCVLMYMTIVVVAVAMVLVYFFRSLYAEPPKMTPFDYEEEEAKQARKKPLTTTVRHEEERAATGASTICEERQEKWR
ncbi:hypothetical protein MRX96_005662 [Rhipicephalus microplus]